MRISKIFLLKASTKLFRVLVLQILYEPPCEKTGHRGFRLGPTQTRLYSHRRRLKAGNFESRKKSDCTISVEKTKALIIFVVTAKLICIFVFAYAKTQFSHNDLI